MSLQQLADAYKVYTDPESGNEWVFIAKEHFSLDEDVVLIANDIRTSNWRANATAARRGCSHGPSMFNGLPWETTESIGRHIDAINFIPMNENLLELV